MLDEDNKNLPDKFGYSHHLFAGQCRNNIGRSLVLISSGKKESNKHSS